jgi:hypothetical protein
MLTMAWATVPTPSDGNCLYHAFGEALRRGGVIPRSSCDAQLLRRLVFSMYTLPFPPHAAVADDERRVWLAVDWPSAADAAEAIFSQLNELVEPLWSQVRARTLADGPILTPHVIVTRAMHHAAQSAPALQRFYFRLMDGLLRKCAWGDEVHLSLLERMFGVHCVVLDSGVMLRQPAAPPHALMDHAHYARLLASTAIVIDGVPTRVRGTAVAPAASPRAHDTWNVVEHALRCLAVSQALYETRARPRPLPRPQKPTSPRPRSSCECSAEVLEPWERCAFCLLPRE